MAKVKMTPSEAIVEQLVAEGVEYAVGIVGSAFMDLLDLFPTAGIKFIPVRDEHTAGHIKGVPQDVDTPKREIMKYVINEYGDFKYMEQVTGDVGNNIVLEPWEYQLELQQLNFGALDWFQGAVTKRDTHISEVYMSSSLQQPVVSISHPVLDDKDEIVAVWMGALTLDRLNELSQQLTFGETGQVYLVDRVGRLAAHPNPELTRKMRSVTDVPMVQKAMGIFGLLCVMTLRYLDYRYPKIRV
jgi:hypothetical protein